MLIHYINSLFFKKILRSTGSVVAKNLQTCTFRRDLNIGLGPTFIKVNGKVPTDFNSAGSGPQGG